MHNSHVARFLAALIFSRASSSERKAAESMAAKNGQKFVF